MLVAGSTTHTARASGCIMMCRICGKQYLPERVEVGMCSECTHHRANVLQRPSPTSRENEEERERRRIQQEEAKRRKEALERERFHAKLERQRQREIEKQRKERNSGKKEASWFTRKH
eukprot:jgi/Antlo1/1083/232